MATNEEMRQAGLKASKEARASNAQAQRRSVVQQTASEMQQVASAMSPEVAASLGAPLDPTRGYDFSPGARPQDLPQPGSAPGGNARAPVGQNMFAGQQMGDMMANGGLPDDHDEVVGPGGPGGPAPTPATAQRPVFHEEPKVEHPTLTSLRLDLGIEKVTAEDVKVGGHKWSLLMLAPSDFARASRIADMADTLTERQLVYQTAIVAHAVVAIDDVPTYQVFGVKPAPGVTVVDHLRPPKSMRYLAAAMLYDFLNDDSRTHLPQRLYDAYDDKCKEKSDVGSYLDDPHNRRMRFRCTEEDCSHELFILPKVKIGTGDVQLPFCRWHGTPMKIVGVEKGNENPLP